MKNLIKKSTSPASRWGEAYPMGNGHMGAMVYGSVPVNEILFSENTFFSGEISAENNQPGAAEAFDKMRRAAKEDQYHKVHKEAEKFIGIRKNYGTNLPVGRLFLNYGVLEQEVSLKERSLNIRTGLAENHYLLKEDGRAYPLSETLFISHPDKRFAVRIAAEQKFSMLISWEAGNAYGSVKYDGNRICFIGNAYETMHCDEKTGVQLTGEAVLKTDGACETRADGIMVTDAKEVILQLGMQTDFRQKAGLQKEEGREGRQQKNADLQKLLCFDKLKKAHCEDVAAYMDRLDLKLQESAFEQVVFEYQYGRYLLLCASRTDSVLPAHLQGIWNDSVACNIGWTCDMHLDINTQMNYWISEPCGLSESSRPLVSWMKKLLVPRGRKTAEISYGRPGWAAELVSNAWGFAAPYWASPIAPCPTGGVWAMMQLWEHYLYSGDEKFLGEDLYPMLSLSVEFFLSYVYLKEDGKWTCGPSISPENSFSYKGEIYQISEGCTYEILMIRELLNVYQKACEVLGEQGEMYQKAGTIAENLLPYRILADGTIAEYDRDFEIPDVQHRHTSHLLGLFPFTQINPRDTPELCQAAERTIRQKLNPEENWEDTGWARSMLLLYEARLLHGERAYGHLNAMLTNLLEPNGMIYHPPTRGAGAFDHVYELDGNTGLTMGITEMLMQSKSGEIHLLPAWPKELCEGSVKGLRARGGILVSFAWKDNRITSVELQSTTDQKIFLRYEDNGMMVYLRAGRSCMF